MFKLAGPRRKLMFMEPKERVGLGTVCNRMRLLTCRTASFDRVTGLLTKDFAARLSVPRKLTKTCATDPSYHEWVGVLQLNPRMVNIPGGVRTRRSKKNRTTTSFVRQDLYGIFAFSTRRHDAVCFVTCFLLVTMHDGCCLNVFHNKFTQHSMTNLR